MQKLKFLMDYQKYSRGWGGKFVHHWLVKVMVIKSTVATILKNKEAIKGANVAMGMKKQLKWLAAIEI